MSDLGIRQVDSFINEDQRWIAPGGLSAFPDNDSITLDMKTAGGFVRATFPNHVIPSGVCLGKITATGLYGPYDDAANDGRQTAVGFLAVTVKWDVNLPVSGNSALLPVALYWHGEIIEAFLPTNHGLDAAGKVDLAAKFRII